ncbi:MAG: selenocysteine-specific translation elongation factor, partial [Actinomycetota bacterium]|nr:selenocysteine-specific translation elongation factor [Actinomycetota bacterium]
MSGELRVIATAGHVDHGKSSLIIRMTGMDPDRWAEEKRRGLTIDLGYAWCTLPSGREIGFVDVPGHERFVGNMLAGVGPVRLVLFVVAADEGWKPQSEEHLQILDVLGVAGGVIALTKRDLVDEETLAIATEEVLERVAGTVLAQAPVIPVSAETGAGIDTLVAALDTLLASAPTPEPARTRLFVDRVFTIKGAGTVATGTLTGGCLSASQTVEVYPAGRRTRVRGLQTYKHDEAKGCPVTRVAANLTGAERDDLARGDVLAEPGSWRPTTVFDVAIRPVRDLERIPGRGAFKVYAGAAEVDAKIRLLDERFARVRTAQPLVLDVFDRFVVRESGRQRTVGGGTVLDV